MPGSSSILFNELTVHFSEPLTDASRFKVVIDPGALRASWLGRGDGWEGGEGGGWRGERVPFHLFSFCLFFFFCIF